MIAVLKKELHAYFTSFLGWIFLALFLSAIGFFVYSINLVGGVAYIGYPLSNASLILALVVPILTMRIIAEETRLKTDQLLLTSPLPIWKIILGKYLALETMLGITMLVVCVYPLIFLQYGAINIKMSYAAILGFFLLGSAYLAIGMFISSISESQAFAAVMTFMVILFTLLAEFIGDNIPSNANASLITFSIMWGLFVVWINYLIKQTPVSIAVFAVGEFALLCVWFLNKPLLEGKVSAVLNVLAVSSAFDYLAQTGVFELRLPVYYISIAFVFCFLTYQNIRKKRYS